MLVSSRSASAICRTYLHLFFSVNSARSVLRPASCHIPLVQRSATPATDSSRSFTSTVHKSHRITSYADPHHLTLIESDLYKKQGEGWGLQNITQTLPVFSTALLLRAHSNARNSNPFMSFTSGFSAYPRGGGLCQLPALARNRPIFLRRQNQHPHRGAGY